jgi:alpha-L-arabinofuranosidase
MEIAGFELISRFNMIFRRCQQSLRLAGFTTLIALLPVVAFAGGGGPGLKNAGFESANPADQWQIESSEARQAFTISADSSDTKDGGQSLQIAASQPVHLTLRQDIFLPVGTLWRLSGWIKSSASEVSPSKEDSWGPPASAQRIGVEAQVGDQGFSASTPNSGVWQEQSFLFRVPSPGRMTVALNAFNDQSGKVWFDDIRLEPVPEQAQEESVTITAERLSNQPINLKQGGQFMEPLCDVLPSMTAQQVQSTGFEEETPWNYSYKAAVDKPYRPWYPDGSVHVATYSFDTNNPYNGKRSQKIELPLANTWAGISQDGFYVEAGHSYRLRLHVRSETDVPVRAFLHGDGGMISSPVSLGRGSVDWRGVEAILTAKRTVQNATLTIEFEGPGTIWLDRVYLIDNDAVLGLWRPDVVKALKAMNPGIVRFGGSAIETFEWEDTLGNWDTRAPYPDEPWGGLQENFIGVEEFVQLVKHIGAEPLICLRWTGKTPQDAANEVEYFNGSADTPWGARRAKNGHPEPYHVKFWEIGNEVGGPEYDASLSAFGEAMRRVDPAIRISSSYPSRNTVRLAGAVLDFLSPHQYSVGDLNETENELKELRDEIEHDGAGKDIRLSVTEWNATAGDWGLKRGMLHTLGNALVCSRYQNMLHRYSDLVEIANVSNLSHSFAGGQLQPGPGYLYEIPDYSAQVLYQRAAGSYALKVRRRSPLSFYLQEPDLNANLTPDGKILRIYGVNSTPEPRKIEFQLAPNIGAAQGGEAFVLGDSSATPDTEAMNLPDEPNRVSTATKKLEVRGAVFEFQFAPFAVTLLEIQTQPKR